MSIIEEKWDEILDLLFENYIDTVLEKNSEAE